MNLIQSKHTNEFNALRDIKKGLNGTEDIKAIFGSEANSIQPDKYYHKNEVDFLINNLNQSILSLENRIQFLENQGD